MKRIACTVLVVWLAACAPLPPKEEVLVMPEPAFRAFVYDELKVCRTATGVTTALSVIGLAVGVTGLIADMRLAAAAEQMAR